MFASTLLSWYSDHKRVLPWRDIKDPYKIWLSEIILQQTRIVQGKDYYLRFIERFPCVEKLAAAPEDEVMKLWEGLGYYSRARNLHFASKQIVDMGHFPEDYDDVKTLKGVGEYTAAAICSMAFGIPIAAIDGNAYRVLSRIYGIDIPFDTTEGKKYFKELANTLLDTQHPGAFNQAMMDFGSLQCTPKSPHCQDCPFSHICIAHEKKQEELFPVRAKKPEIKERFLNYFYVICNGEVLMRKRNGKDIWKSLYEPYLVESTEKVEITDIHDEWLQKQLQKGAVLKEINRNIRHILTHRILWANFYEIQIKETTINPLPEGYQLFPLNELQNLALPTLIKAHMTKSKK